MSNQFPISDQTAPANLPSDPSSSPASAGPRSTGPMPTYAYRDWREERRAERWARHEARRQRHAETYYAWIGGTILLLLGSLLFFQNLGVLFAANWWALLFFIPAFGAYAAAWDNYRKNGSVTRRAVGALVVGVLLTALTLGCLLDLNLSLFWPALLMMVGLLSLWTALFPTALHRG